MTNRKHSITACLWSLLLLCLMPTVLWGQIPTTQGWYQIPNTKLHSVSPPDNSTYGFQYLFHNHIDSWNSGVFDTKRNRLITWGGGHRDYKGNDMYALDLNALTVSRIFGPDTPVADDSLAPETLNGNPNSRHTYSGLAYMANIDRLFSFGGALSGNGSFSRATWTYNFANNTWQNMNPSGPLPRTDSCCPEAAYDPNTGKVFVQSADGLFAYNFSSNSYTQLSSSGANYYKSAVIDPVNKKFVAVGAGNVIVYDISSSSTYAQQTLSTNGGDVIVNASAPGLAFDPVSQRIIAWNEGNTIYSLNLSTGVWTPTTYANGPAARTSNAVGTFGRWAYSPTSGVFVTINNVDSNAYTLRISGTPPLADTTNPSVPTNLSASAVGSSQINLSWTASTDNLGVAGYRIYSCQGNGCTPASQVATVNSGTSYSNSGLSASTTYVYRVAAYDAAGNTSGQSSSASTTTQASTTPPPPSSGYVMPSLTDERNTYTSWGWSWTADKEPNYSSAGTYAVNDPDIHGDTEGDDLWSYLMMYRRTGQRGYLDRANAWATYFKNGYRQCTGSAGRTYCYDRDSFIMDHVYGWGLLAQYEYNGDTAALTAAQNLGLDSINYWSHRQNNTWPTPGNIAMANYSLRQGARHLLLATRLAEITRAANFIDLRDRLIDLWLQSPDWDSRGMYFKGLDETDYNCGAGCYTGGGRIQSPFQIGILVEAFAQAYRTTGRTALRDRIVAMARFVNQYGLDPTYQYSGSVFGIVNGKIWHNYSASGTTTWWDPNYTTSLVNTLVYGYKYTGDQTLYARAKYVFNRGTKGVYGSSIARTSPDNVVDHFVDTRFDSSYGNFYFAYNKGELQYAYLIFENGGSPTIVGTAPPSDTTPPAPPSGLTAQ